MYVTLNLVRFNIYALHQRSGLSRSCKSKSSYLVTSPGRDCVYSYQPASRRSLAQLAGSGSSKAAAGRKSSIDTFASWLPRRKRSVGKLYKIMNKNCFCDRYPLSLTQQFLDTLSLCNFLSELDPRHDQTPSPWKIYNHQHRATGASGNFCGFCLAEIIV